MTRRTFVRHASLSDCIRRPHRDGRSGPEPEFTRQVRRSSADPRDRQAHRITRRARGLRPKVPYFRVPMRQVESKLHRDLPATRLWCYGATSPGPHFRDPQRAGLCGSNGPTNYQPSISCRSITALHGAEADQARSSRCGPCPRRQGSARKRRLSRGLVRVQANREPTSIPTVRRLPRFGITTTPWASTGSTFMPVCSGCSSFATISKTRSIFPKALSKSRS